MAGPSACHRAAGVARDGGCLAPSGRIYLRHVSGGDHRFAQLVLTVATLWLSGCSLAFNTSSGACYHGTVLDVRNGGWEQTCGQNSDMSAWHDPMSPEFQEFLAETVEAATMAALAAYGVGAVGGLVKAGAGLVAEKAAEEALVNTPDGQLPASEAAELLEAVTHDDP